MNEVASRNFLVIVYLSDYEEPIIDRIKQHGPAIKQVMEEISEDGSDPKLAFNSKNADTTGYFVHSQLKSWEIISKLQSPARITSPIQFKDRILVLELGRNFAHHRHDGLLNWMNKYLLDDPSPDL